LGRCAFWAFFYANEAACKSLGYTLGELTRLTIVQIDPNFDEASWDVHAAKLEKTKKTHFKTQHRKKDGTIFPVEVIASVMTYRGKEYNVAFAIDISEREAKERALKQSEAMLRESQVIAKIGSWELDFQTNELAWSEQVYTILGLVRDEREPMFKDFVETIYPDDREMVVTAFEESLKDESKPYDIVHRALVKGKMKYLHEQCRTARDSHGQPIRSIGTVRDVTDEQELMEQVAYLSHHDSLTRLPNQLHFKQELVYALRRAKKTDTLVAVCFIDLDDFKYVNDVYSHELGDQILQAIASRLLTSQSHEHSVARFGADEFVVLIEDIHNAAQATLQLQPILEAIREPVVMQNEKIEVGASAGISLYPADSTEPEDLIKFADAATHRAKSLGKNRLTFYTEDFTNEMSQKMRLISTMRSAIGTAQFVLYYQPQVDLKTLKICGVEALVRWEHPEFGFTSPDVFIPPAEESGLIVPLGKWILETACVQMATWKKAGIFDGTVAVNVSGIQLEAEGFSAHVKSALEKSGLDPSHVELEITESSLMGNVDAWLDTLAELGSLGVHLAIDDFGTGYSSLAHLRQMPVDVLKIDRTFVWDLPHKSGACAIAETVVGLAENMKMHALAEGIETKEQLHFLQKAGCEKGQGFYFSKPLPADEVETLLRQAHPFST
jgi:diguanylate cyclase (GGDEF)-like protein/PAS domain S-box-containing protein